MSQKLSSQTDVPEIKGYEKPEDHLNDRLFLTDFEIQSGKFGDYMIMTVKDPILKETFQVSTGARQIMDVLGGLNFPLDEPIEFMFYQQGRALGIKDYAAPGSKKQQPAAAGKKPVAGEEEIPF
jgi:hypothetical protein